MRTLVLLAAFALAFPLAGLAAGQAATATLDVGFGSHLAPAAKSCRVAIPAGLTAADLLDAAAHARCISGWEAKEYDFGRFVQCIDGVCGQDVGGLGVAGTFWAFYVNEKASFVGVDDYAVKAGDVVEFVYMDWYVGGLLP